jgi:hypothetical protein
MVHKFKEKILQFREGKPSFDYYEGQIYGQPLLIIGMQFSRTQLNCYLIQLILRPSMTVRS